MEMYNDEILSIEYIGEQDTIDINTSGNRLFYANGILTHNSAVEEIEFDHSHISGGISKINTADNVFGIFTSRAMRERGRYQIQLMKTRSSSGVGMKVDLDFDIESLRITDPGEEAQGTPGSIKPQIGSIMNQIKTSSKLENVNKDTGEISTPQSEVQSTKLKQMLASLKSKVE
jgi:hypothetical protein